MISFNEAVMAGLYIHVSEMSIVGPPPLTGRRFFLPKRKEPGTMSWGRGLVGRALGFMVL